MSNIVYALTLFLGTAIIMISSVWYAVSNSTIDKSKAGVVRSDTLQLTTKRFQDDPSPPVIIRRIEMEDGRTWTEYWRPFVNSKGQADLELFQRNEG